MDILFANTMHVVFKYHTCFFVVFFFFFFFFFHNEVNIHAVFSTLQAHASAIYRIFLKL